MKQVLRCLILLLMAAWSLSFADRPAPQREYTIGSPNGNFEFTMKPGSSQGALEPYGEAFSITPDGDQESAKGGRELLWQVTGWYSPQTFISNDGRSLVRMGPWASRPVTEELAVAFYRDGCEVRRYVVADLIVDHESVKRSVSHYSWLASNGDLPRLTEDGRFQLRTIEDRLVTFDLSTGEILDSDH